MLVNCFGALSHSPSRHPLTGIAQCASRASSCRRPLICSRFCFGPQDLHNVRQSAPDVVLHWQEMMTWTKYNGSASGWRFNPRALRWACATCTVFCARRVTTSSQQSSQAPFPHPHPPPESSRRPTTRRRPVRKHRGDFRRDVANARAKTP